MKKAFYFIPIAIGIYLSVLFLIACNKNSSTNQGPRLSAEFKRDIEMVGKAHNAGLTDFVTNHSDLLRTEVIPYFEHRFRGGGSNRVAVNGVRLNDDPPIGEWEDITMTREYFLNYMLYSLPQFEFPLQFGDSLLALPLGSISSITINDSNLVSMVTSNVSISTQLEYYLGLVQGYINSDTTTIEFNAHIDGLVTAADSYITNDTEFKAFALACSIGKYSFAYWTDEDNLAHWNAILDGGPNTTNSVRKDKRVGIDYMKPKDKAFVRGVVASDIGGGIYGAVQGGFFGSVGGPAGTLLGIVGGGLYQGLQSSALSYVQRTVWSWIF